ncbi:16S rRNA (guanine(966)-N(2))-methyltransferase RsmD [Peptoanaerobacter stomatis]|uniref:RsmD family RNA methyltransferase n=1 Tax=Peptoanaerobacter stomatis TaxID=796937 RepID=G9X373_9FIRM|nr:16S rRNA (guanine(966)-N(2))-methyltransferase RsmD [Peptoanaerobacter stomatis]EHL10615.1 RsmD family RNA methyltransferase [Peptoanaerobacter stomatis]
MRVISGKYRGKKLLSPKDDDIRPTTDRVKESMFNMIQNYIYGSKFLDLFSGSGAIGIEAFSRDAKHITMVENAKDSLKLINANLKSINADKGNIELVNRDVIDFLKTSREKYDIIFADPPYDYSKINEIIKIVSDNKLLSDEGILIIETEKDFTLEECSDFIIEKEKIYSISKLTVMKINNLER